MCVLNLFFLFFIVEISTLQKRIPGGTPICRQGVVPSSFCENSKAARIRTTFFYISTFPALFIFITYIFLHLFLLSLSDLIVGTARTDLNVDPLSWSEHLSGCNQAAVPDGNAITARKAFNFLIKSIFYTRVCESSVQVSDDQGHA